MTTARYSIGQAVDNISAARVLATLTAGAASVVYLEEVRVTCRGVVTAEQLRFAIYRISAMGSPTVTHDNISGGNNNLTIQEFVAASAATGCAVRINVTTEGGLTLNSNPLIDRGVPNSLGFIYTAEPYHATFDGNQIYLANNESIAVKLMESPDAETDFDVELIYTEVS